MNKLLLSLLFIVLTIFQTKAAYNPNTWSYEVTTNADSGPGSLRQAIIDFNNDILTIPSALLNRSVGFVIPNPVANAGDDITIHLYSPLPVINFDGLGFGNNDPVNHAYSQVILSGLYLPNPHVAPIVYQQGIKYRSSYANNHFISFAGRKILVTNTNDVGVGSLTEAILEANMTPEQDTIVFDIPGMAPHKINLSYYLPFILTPMIIDGSTQPAYGYTGNNPKIELDGTNLTYSSYESISAPIALGACFSILGTEQPGSYPSSTSYRHGNNVNIYGLYIHNFPIGIHLYGHSYIIGAPNKGNVISGNSKNAILFGQPASSAFMDDGSICSSVTIQNNLIGTTPDGKSAMPNGTVSSTWYLYDNSVFGLEGSNINILNNVISGNTACVFFAFSQMPVSGIYKKVNGLIIKGNKIGTDIDGQYAIPNGHVFYGDNGAAYPFLSNVQIGGSNISDRNLISGNTGFFNLGVCTNLSIENNYIGTDITGNNPIPNAFKIETNTSTNISIKNNLIANNTINPLVSGVNAIITKNSIYNNSGSIITNPNLAAPLITYRSVDSISGTSKAYMKIELYQDNGFNNFLQGKDFIAQTVSDGNGNWRYKGSLQNPVKVIAIAIDTIRYQTSSYSQPAINLGPNKTFCIADTAVLDAGSSYYSYLWSTGETTQKIKAITNGDYWVEVSDGILSYRDTIKINYIARPVVSLGKDTTLCSGRTITLNAGNPGATYRWNNVLASQTKTISTGGTYIVEVAFNNCKNSDTIQITSVQGVSTNLGPDKTVCTGTSLVLNASGTNVNYLWSDGKTTSTDTVTVPGKYWVKVSNAYCIASDTIIINNVSVNVNLGRDTTLCTGQSLTLDAGNSGATYKWNNNNSLITQTRSITTNGLYFVDVTKGNCTKRDSINVLVKAIPVINLSDDTTACQGSSFVLNAGNPGCQYKWSTGSISQSITISSSGTYSVEVYHEGACHKKDSIQVAFVDCSVLSGTVYEESNSDCLQNAGERAISGRFVSLKNTDNGKNYYATTDAVGNYELSVPYGNYEVALVPKPDLQILCPATKSYLISANNTVIAPKNFGVKITSITNFSIGINNLSSLRLNSLVTYSLTYSNIGTLAKSGVVKLVKDPFMEYYMEQIAGAQINGDTLTYNYSLLNPGESNTIPIIILIPFNRDLTGKNACVKASVIPSETDASPSDNVMNSCSIYAYPFDPNNKQVYPAGASNEGFIGSKDTILTYTINFQNTGTDTARSVTIKDTLSSLLDVASFEKIGSSYPCDAQITGEGILTFSFNNIMLPDSNINEPASHGFVQFTIHRKKDAPDASVITNEAFIFFDQADPVPTNKTITTLNYQQSIQTIQFDQSNMFTYQTTPVTLSALASSALPVNYVVSGPATLDGDNLTITGAGEIRVRVYQEGNADFAPVFTDKIFTILKANQVISFDSIPDLLDNEEYSLHAVGGNSGLPIVYTVLSGPAVINGNTVSFIGTGDVSIEASQQGDDNYSDANPVIRTLTVSTAQTTEITIDQSAKSKMEVYPNPSTGMFTVTIVNGDLLQAQSTIQLFNSAGIMVNTRTASNYNEYTMELTKGTYYIKFFDSGKIYSQKIVIQ
ncbi:MAG TPA: T9SS type A sorting domain-containing protein [Cytophagaceae bacterium]|jgi:hypothetical protein|nr:T9SS type A sorting domain-containing protein [Cytophagaceae bacterium]